MVTFKQLGSQKGRVQRVVKNKRLALGGCPQKRGTCVKVYIMTPKKPCSARRAFTRVRLSNHKMVTCHIPGEGHNLKRFSSVLVRGGRPNDLPAVKYKVIRGAKRTDLQPVHKKKNARSKYGVKNPNRYHTIRKTRGVGTKIYYTAG